MTAYLTLFLAAAAFAIVLTPLVRTAGSALGLVDAPSARKVHLQSVPRLGGLAIIASAGLGLATVPLVVPASTGLDAFRFAPFASIIPAALLVFAVGLFDDVRPLPAWVKVTVEVTAALMVMRSAHLIERVTFAGTTWQLGFVAWPVTLVWIVGLTNAFNLIDGIDGLAAGVTAIAGAACATILIARGHAPEAMLLTAVVGAAIGFLAYNFPPASIFLGDGGSLLFGFVLATTAITGWQKGATALAAGVPLLIFALPIADSGTTLLRRAFRRGTNEPVSLLSVLRQIAQPDRQHIHHRLLALGWTPRATVVFLYAVTLILSGIALATASFD